MGWFEDQRLEWIAETLRVFGYINREHIERKFGISTPQASLDLRTFMERHPGQMSYNGKSKRYEAARQDREKTGGRAKRVEARQ